MDDQDKVVQIVRCKDCKFKQDSSVAGRTWWCNRLKKFCDDEWFCADGKRQDPGIEPEIEGDRYGWYYACSDCHGYINWKDSFCRHCGRRINWNGENL